MTQQFDSQDRGRQRADEADPSESAPTAVPGVPLRCTFFGHDYSFGADGPIMSWSCSRGCGAGGSKTYASAEQAQRYAQAFDKRDRDDLGRRAPLIGLLPLRIWRWLNRKTHERQRAAEGDSHGQG